MTLDRRLALLGGLAGLGGCAVQRNMPRTGLSIQDIPPPLAPIRAHKDRIFDITVCLRPFRAQGARLDTETIGDTLVVHNYGHGGSGWSLSWGSGTIAVQKALANSPKQIAVLGCGALGITSAILAQRAGVKVTIYCKELLQQARSARATGGWTPDSRIALKDAAGPAFGALWEQMARTSWKTYRDYLGLPGDPVVFNDRYRLNGSGLNLPPSPGALDFAEYQDSYAPEIRTAGERMPPGSTPFDWPTVTRSSELMFNLRSYGHLLMTDFLTAGGQFVRTEFHEPGELARLPQKVVINCPGYAARSGGRISRWSPCAGRSAG